MGGFLLRRGLGIVPVLFGVSVVVFLLLHLAPGDAASSLLGPNASEEARQALRHALGLDKPWPIQYVRWLETLLHGNFGVSIATSMPVAALLGPRIEATLILGSASLLLAVFVGVGLGFVVSGRPRGVADRLCMPALLVVGSVPPFWLGLVLVLLFAIRWRIFPVSGMTDIFGGGGLRDIGWHLVLPMVTTAAIPAAVIARMVRGTMLEVLGQDYILVARAKGIPMSIIMRRHAFRNALPPILTIVGLQMGYLLGGTIFSEVVFAWPGLGQALYAAIQARDIPVVQATVLFMALVFVLVNLAVDLVNRAVDPRAASDG